MSASVAHPWQQTREEFFQRIPFDIDAEIETRVARRIQQAEAFRRRHPESQPVDAEAIRDEISWEFRRLKNQMQSAWMALWMARRALQQAFPKARVDVAGSFAQGKFFEKGLRDFDVDLHITGLPYDASEGDETVLPSRAVAAALERASQIARRNGADLDLFVTHEGKLWGMLPSFALTRKPARFGKEMHEAEDGTMKRGAKVDWDTFELQFRKDLATHETLVREALERGDKVPERVLREYPALARQSLHGRRKAEIVAKIDEAAGAEPSVRRQRRAR